MILGKLQLLLRLTPNPDSSLENLVLLAHCGIYYLDVALGGDSYKELDNNSFIKYGILTVGISIFCFPSIFLFYLRFILKCSYEILIIKKDMISSYISKNYCINKSKFKNLNKKFEISNLEKIYFKEYPIWAIVRGVKYEENPYFKLHFKLKDGEQFDFGLMLNNNEAKEILREVKEFLNINKLT